MRRTGLMYLIIAMSLAAVALAAEVEDTKTKKAIIDMMRDDNPASIPLEGRPGKDPTLNAADLYRACNEDNPDRDWGPINIQKAHLGMSYQGIPTFFRAPVALCPKDLEVPIRKTVEKDGKKEVTETKIKVAIMGASLDMSVGQRGTAFAPQAIRTGEIVIPWGTKVGHPTVGYIESIEELGVVDYGDAAIDILSNERSILSVHKMVKDIADKRVIPVIVGGDHSLMYPDVVAIVDSYDKDREGKVGVIHFDAHFDGIPLLFGHYLSHGAPVRRLIDEGHIKGKNFVQIGLNSGKPGLSDIQWMRQNQVRYHFMNEIDRDGAEAVLNRALAEASDGTEYIFVSIDTDVLDPAWAPGMGTPEPGGMTIRELFPMLRAIGVKHNIVGIDLVEVNPIVDQTYRSKLVAVRILREILTGIAMRERDIKDPYHVDPLWKDHGVPAPK